MKNNYVYQHLVKAKLFVDRNFSDRISLTQLAQQAHLSKFHFSRLFKSVYRQTPNRYLTSVRLRRARQLLKQGYATLEACQAVNYESPGTFKTLFKKQVGQTPLTYRQHQHKQITNMKKHPARFIPHCLTKIGQRKKKQY